MSRPDDYGIVTEAIKRLDLGDTSRDWGDIALAALERLAEGEHDKWCACDIDADPDCANVRRDCLAKVRG